MASDLLMIAVLAGITVTTDAAQPHIIFIVADDLGKTFLYGF